MNPEKWHESIAQRVHMLQPCVDAGLLTVDEARALIYTGPISDQYTLADAFRKGFKTLPCNHDFQTHHLFTSSYRKCEKCGVEEC